MNRPTLRAVKLTLHSWELPSWPREHLRAATAGALRVAIDHYYPHVRVEVAYNAAPDEPVYDPLTGDQSVRGAKLELDIRGGTYDERHTAQHRIADAIEGIMRRTLLIFVEHDAKSRLRQAAAGYKTYDDLAEPPAPESRINV